jgi:hypothetical protein
MMTGDFTYLHTRPDILNITLFSGLLIVAIAGKNNQITIIYSFVEKMNI